MIAPPRQRAALVMLVVGVTLVGCGGSGDEGSEAREPLPQGIYLQEISAACADGYRATTPYNAALQALLPQSGRPGVASQAVRSAQQDGRKAASDLQASVRAARALVPPPSLRGFHTAYVTRVRAMERVFGQMLRGIDEGDRSAIAAAVAGVKTIAPVTVPATVTKTSKWCGLMSR